LRRAGYVLIWGGVLVLGAFGAFFTFANYPLFGTGIVLVALLLTSYSERKRRRKQRTWERTRRRDRTRSGDS
jgi:membrane protein implicated in regulation of membrane protease activity